MSKRFWVGLSLLVLVAVLGACSGEDAAGVTTPSEIFSLDVEEAQPTQGSVSEELAAQGAATLIDDPDGLNGKAYLYMQTNDTLSWTDALPPGRYTLVARARAELYEGAPELVLSLGDTNVSKLVSSTRYENVSFGSFDFKEGDTLSATFSNDVWGGSPDKDRNLILSHLFAYPEGYEPPAPSPEPEPEPEPANDFTAEQWGAINEGGVNNADTQWNMEQAVAIYGAGLVGATPPIARSVTENAASFDPWAQYISPDNAALTVHSFLVRVRNNDGRLVFKTFSGEQIAAAISQGNNGAAFDFRNNSTQPLNVNVNSDGSVSLGKEKTEFFTHFWFGGQQGGAKGVVMAIKVSGNGYLQLGVDFKNAKFEDFPGQDGNDGSYHSPVHSAYQRVTGTPQWFGLSNANE